MLVTVSNSIDKLEKYSERYCKNNHCKIVDTYCDVDTLMYRVIGINHHNAYRFVFYYDEDTDQVEVLESRSGLLSL